MAMTLRRIAPILIVAAAVGAPSALARSNGNSLVGTVGPGFTITLTQGGKAVKTLKPGTYTVKVNDEASIHNFHLFGKGVNKSTSVSGTGAQTWKVTFKAGSYTFQCDPHAFSGMKGTFKVK